MPEPTRLIVADDHRMFREAIVKHLISQSGIQVIAETDNGAEVIELSQRLRPDMVLLDLNLNGMDGVEVLRLMKSQGIMTSVIVFSMYADPGYVGQVMSHDIAGYILKDEALEDLLTAIDTVRKGGHFFSQKLGPLPKSHRFEGQPHDGLTEREIEILTLIASGLSTAEIGSKLGRSVKTVETHRTHLGRKLGIRNVADLTRYAIRYGYISP